MKPLAAAVADVVREMDAAARHARASAFSSLCDIGSHKHPCRDARCIERSAHDAAWWTQTAARLAITLESLVDYSEGP